MADGSTSLDWTQVQSFAAVAAEGSLSGAARKLGQSQPTVGRHIKALEQSLGVDLFTRAPRGLIPTQAGLEILDHARAMESAAANLRRTADGRADDLRGTVRITASVAMSHFVLPRVLARMRRDLPEVQVELVPSDTTENLIFREADIAVRMYRPTQLDVVTRHVVDLTTSLYAATSYLDRVGRPQNLDALMQLDFIGYDKNDLIIRMMGEMGLSVTRDFFPVRCDDQAAHWHLTVAGCGIGAAQTQVGDVEPRVERVLSDLVLPRLPVWLTAPEALRTNRRIRAVWDYLAEAMENPSGA